MLKKIIGYFFRKRPTSEVTYADIKRRYKKYSKSQLIRMLTMDQVIIDNLASEFKVKDVRVYAKRRK